MKILQLFGLGDTSTLLTVGLRRLGVDCDLLLSNRAFVTQYPSWTKKYPELTDGCYHWDSSNLLDPSTVVDLFKFVRDYDLIFAHPPAGSYAWHMGKPFTIWDGGSGNFILNKKYNDSKMHKQITREVVRRSYKKADWIFFNDINVLYLAWKNISWNHDRYCYMPLPVDTEVFRPMDVEPFPQFTAYMPTRQEVHIKGIEEILKGWKMFVKDVPSAKLAITRYGSDVPVTEHLIDVLGLKESVVWVPLMPKPKFAEMINKVDVVIDQLMLNALGGVSVQSMACEQRVIVGIKQEWYREQLGKNVPIYNAHTAKQVCGQLLHCHYSNDTQYRKEGRKFIKKHFEYNKVAKRVYDVLEMIT